MIVVTGAAGFIASGLVGTLNRQGISNIVLVDDFGKTSKKGNWETKQYAQKVDRDNFLEWFDNNASEVEFVFHLGARTDTTEFDWSVFERLNLNYTKEIWNRCAKYEVPLIYASSAATYGDGELGYKDSHDIVEQLKPLNPYGCSKNEFDKWALKQEKQPPFWAGTKFFNVYGPNEYHKGRMASVVIHTFETVQKTGKMKFKEISKFPSISKDLAILIDKNISADEIAKVIKKAAGSLLTNTEIFDVYEGKNIPEGKRSIAYSLSFGANDRTLTDEEINNIMNKVIESLQKMGAELRA